MAAWCLDAYRQCMQVKLFVHEQLVVQVCQPVSLPCLISQATHLRQYCCKADLSNLQIRNSAQDVLVFVHELIHHVWLTRELMDASAGRERLKVATRTKHTITFGDNELDLSSVVQLVEKSQTRTIADVLQLLHNQQSSDAVKELNSGTASLSDVLQNLEKCLDSQVQLNCPKSLFVTCQ